MSAMLCMLTKPRTLDKLRMYCFVWGSIVQYYDRLERLIFIETVLGKLCILDKQMYTRQANVYQTSQCMLNEPVHLGQAVDVKYDHAIVYVYTRTCVRVHICVFAFMCLCTYVYMHICIYAYMYICIYLYIFV